jgi:cell division protease FtsH
VKKTKTVVIWSVLFAVVLVLLWQSDRGPEVEMSFSEFLEDVASQNVASVEVNGQEIIVTDAQGLRYKTNGILDSALVLKLSEQAIPVSFESGSWITGWITFAIPVVLLLAFLLYFVRKSKGEVGNIMSLRRSPHREISGTESRVTFKDVGGCEEAKIVLGDVIDFLKSPQRWLDAGVRLPRGILLEGPPGCGKTLLARAVAGETNAKFFLVAGSEFVEMFVGVGAARVRDLFETAIKKAPSVVFIDELDALGRRRGSGIGSSHDEREQTLNQLLVCLDGFKSNDRVVVLAATNRPDVLDQALVRAGRIDRRIRVPQLTEQARVDVLRIHTRGKPIEGVDLLEIARLADGFNGAQLENLCNEAALLAVRRARQQSGNAPIRVTAEDFAHAMQPTSAQNQRFNRVDSILIESASQLAEPAGAARVRLRLADATLIEGEVVWADATFLKVRRPNGEADIIVPKRQVRHLEVLDGTDPVFMDELQIDKWAGRPTETA